MFFLKTLFGTSKPSVSHERLTGGIDWHCHILPGVDDGFQEMEKSLEMLATYEEIGIREVWFTPHIMEDVPNTTARLRQVFDSLEKNISRISNGEILLTYRC